MKSLPGSRALLARAVAIGGLLLVLSLGGLAATITSAAAVQQQQPPTPPPLPSAPPPATPPSGPQPPATPTALPTVSARVTPEPPVGLPTPPPTIPGPILPTETAADEDAAPAFVTVVLRPDRSAPRPGTTQTFLVVATNRGEGRAKETVITLPLDPARNLVVAASFSRPGAWVSRLDTASLELRIGPLAGHGDTVTTTLQLAIPDPAPAGADLVERLDYSWSDAVDGGEGASNKVDLAVGGPPFNPLTQLVFAAGAEGGVTSSIFAPGEPVGVWLQSANGTVTAVDTLIADEEGRISLTYETNALAKGAYTMVAYGLWTELTAIAPFSV